MYTIYCLYCKCSGKVYVGQTKQSLHRRWGLHKSRARTGYHHQLYCAMRLYGDDAFERNVLAEVETREEADRLEILSIALLNATDSDCGYNNTYGGEGGRPTPEGVEKQRQKMLGRKQAPETVERKRASLKQAWAEGRHSGNKGKSFSSDTAEKMRQRMLGTNSHNYRKDVTAADVIPLRQQGLSLREIGKRLNCHADLVSKRIKESGQVFSPVRNRSAETREKIGAAFRGMKRSPEFCQKTRDGVIAWWVARKAGLENGATR